MAGLRHSLSKQAALLQQYVTCCGKAAQFLRVFFTYLKCRYGLYS
jgi:hypothetical protein